MGNVRLKIPYLCWSQIPPPSKKFIGLWLLNIYSKDF